MPDFSRIISMAYMRILGRPPDPEGLESYDRAMNAGLTEAQMRESLLRSQEYANKHPDKTSTVARSSSPPRKKTTRKKKSGKKTSTKKSPRRSRS